MGDKKLEKLCGTIARLCDVPETSPGSLYGLKKCDRDDPHSAASDLYKRVVKSVEKGLKDKGLIPESNLIQGFDQEQQFQQVALLSQEVTSLFIPQIAFSETQLSELRLPLGIEPEDAQDVEGDKSIGKEFSDDRKEDGGGNVEGVSSDSDDDLWKRKRKSDGALSGSEEEDEEPDEDESLNLKLEDDELSSVSAEEKDEDDWDEVEAQESSTKGDEKQPLSSYERSRLKLSAEIERMEEKQLEEKPWQMKGEAVAAFRPVNSLLEEVLEYDLTQRPAPIVTEQVTHKLEDVILKRIKDKAFDDVERKIKPIDAPSELRKKIVLDQEKSKLSLAEVYEQEYLKQKSKAKAEVSGALPTSALPDAELTAEEKEINSKLTKLFAQLDCLSNFHYTAPPRLAEVEIVANLPAVNVEEVGQEALTDANLLTAGEVSGSFKKDIKGSSEKTKTDKKRERRKKKVHQAKKFKKLQLSTSVKTAHPTPGKGKIKLADPALKSSTNFFSQLEVQAKKHIDGNKRVAEEDAKNKFKAKKLKL